MIAAPVHRHQLAWLSLAAWDRILESDRDAEAARCFAHWARARLPLVVTRQSGERVDSTSIAMGLPTPPAWGRRRLELAVDRRQVLYFDEFPLIHEIGSLIAPPVRRSWKSLCSALRGCDAQARVFGSFGWEQLSGLRYRRPGSDLDLSIAVANAHQADRVVACLLDADEALPRLDGELSLDNGWAVAWREWAAWRQGRSSSILVRHLRGAFLSSDPFWNGARAQAGAHP